MRRVYGVLLALLGLSLVTGGIVYAGGPATVSPTPTNSSRPSVPAVSEEHSPAAPSQPGDGGSRYVALGDSVAAGYGLWHDTGEINRICSRSKQSYPYIIARQKGLAVENYACTGAKIDEGVLGSQIRENTQLFPQIDRAFFNGTPTLVTATIGANDMRWVDIIKKCYGATCGSTVETYALKVLRADIRAELYATLWQIRSRSEGTPPKVLVSGYYSPFENDVSCMRNNAITPSEAVWIDQQTIELNNAIASTVKQFDFAQFVPIDFDDHGVCAEESWLKDIASSAPLHPTARGQQAIAEAFIPYL